MDYKSSISQFTLNKLFTKILLFGVFFYGIFSHNYLLGQEIVNVESIYISEDAHVFIQSEKELIVLSSKNHQGKKDIQTVSKKNSRPTSIKKEQPLVEEKTRKVVEQVKSKPEVFFAGTSSPNSFNASRETADVFFNNFQNYHSAKLFFVSSVVLFPYFIKEKKIISKEVFFRNALYSIGFFCRPPPNVFVA